MSRSHVRDIVVDSSPWPYTHNNKSYRAICRMLIQREIFRSESDDIVYPSYKGFYTASRGKTYNNLARIRRSYFLDINNILNAYTDKYGFSQDECFLDAFGLIKKGLPCNEKTYRDIIENVHSRKLMYVFGWVNDKNIKKAIKVWNGSPFDLLKYLSDHRFIEKAVHTKFKTQTAK